MKRIKNKYDLVVVGGGHAGIEAALIAHKRGIKTLLVSMDKKSVGRTSCNPAVGGLAKGQMIKEVDVLGGIMGFFADLSTCLLYTSPSPRDLSTSRMPSSA